MAERREKFDRERAARVLVEASTIGTRATCDKYAISERTLKRYRARLGAGDTELAQKVTDKRALVDADWAEELPGAIREAIGFLKRSAEEADVKDPDAIHSVAGALKILTDVTMSRRILDARLAKATQQHAGDSGQTGSTGGEDRQEPSGRPDQLGLQ